MWRKNVSRKRRDKELDFHDPINQFAQASATLNPLATVVENELYDANPEDRL
jgi:hypothetical protein